MICYVPCMEAVGIYIVRSCLVVCVLLQHRHRLPSAPAAAPTGGTLTGAPLCPQAHNTVSSMVQSGAISREVGLFLNGSLTAHSYCCAHACVHGGVAQHDPEHEAVEAMLYRLASGVLLLEDGHCPSHRTHHHATNTDDDPDWPGTSAPLPQVGLGHAINHNTPLFAGNAKHHGADGTIWPEILMRTLHFKGLDGESASSN